MTESGISRIGAATGVVSVVVTFVGFGVHGALPTDTTAAAVETYVKSVSASQAGIGNYLELLGYLLFLALRHISTPWVEPAGRIRCIG